MRLKNASAAGNLGACRANSETNSVRSFEPTTGAAFAAGTTFVVVDNNTTGAATTDQFASGLTQVFDQAGNPYDVNYAFNAGDAGGANDLAIVAAVPEPVWAALLAFAGLGLLARRRRGRAGAR
jgi:hypothetical protein